MRLLKRWFVVTQSLLQRRKRQAKFARSQWRHFSLALSTTFTTTAVYPHFSTPILRSKEHIDFLIAGLGNPGEDYEHTLHNVGFDVVDLIAEELRVTYWKNGGGALYAETTTSEGKNILLAKPQSFMNTSGGPISTLMKENKLAPANLIVIHDDLDLEPGRIRVKAGGSAGGHNGLKSIINKLGSTNFTHVKVGIGHPPGRKPVIDWVLSKPLKANAEALEVAKVKAAEAALALTSRTVPEVQNEFNQIHKFL